MQAAFILAADASWWERVRRDPNTAFTVSELLIGISAIGAVVLVWWLWVKWQRFQERRKFESPWALFAELCQAHECSRQEVALLRAVARQHRLEQPAQLFLRPELYWPPHVPSQLAGQQRELVQLHARIFNREKQAADVAELA
jgi:hypothetical protein